MACPCRPPPLPLAPCATPPCRPVRLTAADQPHHLIWARDFRGVSPPPPVALPPDFRWHGTSRAPHRLPHFSPSAVERLPRPLFGAPLFRGTCQAHHAPPLPPPQHPPPRQPPPSPPLTTPLPPPAPPPRPLSHPLSHRRFSHSPVDFRWTNPRSGARPLRVPPASLPAAVGGGPPRWRGRSGSWGACNPLNVTRLCLARCPWWLPPCVPPTAVLAIVRA